MAKKSKKTTKGRGHGAMHQHGGLLPFLAIPPVIAAGKALGLGALSGLGGIAVKELLGKGMGKGCCKHGKGKHAGKGVWSSGVRGY